MTTRLECDDLVQSAAKPDNKWVRLVAVAPKGADVVLELSAIARNADVGLRKELEATGQGVLIDLMQPRVLEGQLFDPALSEPEPSKG